MIIKYKGSLREAQILARSGDRMRIAWKGGDDAMELRLANGTWLSEEQERVSFGFLDAPEIPLVVPENLANPPPTEPLLSRHAVADGSGG